MDSINLNILGYTFIHRPLLIGGKVRFAPMIDGPVEAGRVEIREIRSARQAMIVARLLEAGPLSRGLRILAASCRHRFHPPKP